MSESVNLPALGESVTEGTVTRWLKKVGDRVEVDEPLLEVSTDKVDTEIPSPLAGIVEQILVQEDETVEVGTPLVSIGGTGSAPASTAAPETSETLDAPTETSSTDSQPVAAVHAAEVSPAATPGSEPEAPASTSMPSPQVEPAQTTNSGYVTPLVRKLAGDHRIDLSALRGTGVGGRIRKEDILEVIEAQSSAPSKADTANEAPSTTTSSVSELRGTTVPLSRLRKVIAERAVASMQETAQLTTVVEVDLTRVANLREKVKATFLEKTGTKLSFLPFFARAAVEALKSYPIINATLDGDAIVYPDYENVSIAVDTERGLLTPVIRDAGSLDIAGLAREIADLAARTRDNKLKPDELAGGTFTLTNTGSRGALFDTPVVFLPQVAILGTGIVTKKPVVISVDGEDTIAIRSTVYLALSYDHRIVDGADAARFLTAVKNRLETGDFMNDLGI